jgi:putative peptidoglycan lipid II flippase
MSQLLKSSGAMSAATMLSRVLGLGREMAYAAFMGAGWVADAFTLAFMVPNLFRRLLGEGALTAAFIPIFKAKEKTEGDQAMWRAANAVVSGLTLGTVGIVFTGMFVVSAILLIDLPGAAAIRAGLALAEWSPWLAGLGLVAAMALWTGRDVRPVPLWRTGLVWIAATGSALLGLGLLAIWMGIFKEAGGGKTLLMLRLLRVMFPYLVLVCIAATFMGMLNSRGHFFVPAMGATMLNVVMISSVLVVLHAPKIREWPLERQIFGLAVGVVAAGFAQAAFQYPLLRRDGFRYQWINPWREPTVVRVVQQMIPGAVGVAAFQINVLVTQGMAFGIDAGLVAAFTYAVRLMEFPQGIFGISLATYLLPTLSGLAAEKKYPEFRQTLAHGVGWLMFANLLASALLLTLAEPMIRLLFERGKFDAASTLRSASALAALAPGLVAFSVVNVLARAFYALGDTKTPMRISIFCLLLNIVVSAALMFPFREAGLGAANTATSLVNVSLLSYALRRKLKTLDMGGLTRRCPALLGAALVAGATAWGLAHLWTSRFGHGSLILKLGEVFVPIAGASLVYLLLNLWLKTGFVEESIQLVFGRMKRPPGPDTE